MENLFTVHCRKYRKLRKRGREYPDFSKPFFRFSKYSFFFTVRKIGQWWYNANRELPIKGFLSERVLYILCRVQCDQIGWFFCTLGNHSKPDATIILPKLPTLLGNFCKGVKIIHFLLKSFLGNFYRHLAIFIWSHWLCYSYLYLFELTLR